MKKMLLATLAAVVLVGLDCAAWSQNAGGYKLVHRSSFTVRDNDHNPFWPIGWVKTNVSATSDTTVEVREIRAEDFTVTGISLVPLPTAIINGKFFAEGDQMLVPSGGQNVKVLVARVTDGLVILRYGNKEYTIELKRKGEELHAPKPAGSE